jgi:hypothetical protein
MVLHVFAPRGVYLDRTFVRERVREREREGGRGRERGWEHRCMEKGKERIPL